MINIRDCELVGEFLENQGQSFPVLDFRHVRHLSIIISGYCLTVASTSSSTQLFDAVAHLSLSVSLTLMPRSY